MVRRRTKRAKIEGDFAKALTGEVVIAGILDYPVVVSRLRRLQRFYLPMLPPNSADALEIKRRIAEQMYEQALFHGCSRAVCRARLRTLSKLGFTDVERKAHFYLLDARAAFSSGDKAMARRQGAAIIRELEGAPKRGRNPLRNELLRLTNALLQQLDDSAWSGPSMRHDSIPDDSMIQPS